VPTAIFRDGIRRLEQEEGAQLVDVLPREEYEDEQSDPKVPVEEAMSNCPATFRPNEPVGKMAKRIQDREATTVLVTTSDGRLVGLVYREDAEQLAGVQT
jgi:Mg/Co/Ni transporter MgtE